MSSFEQYQLQGRKPQAYRLISNACIPFMFKQYPDSHSGILYVWQGFLTQQMMVFIEILP